MNNTTRVHQHLPYLPRTAEVEGSDRHDILTMEQRINALTGEQLQAAAKRFFNRQNYVEMVLKPEA